MSSDSFIAVLKWAVVTVVATGGILSAPFGGAPRTPARIDDCPSAAIHAWAGPSYICAMPPRVECGRFAVIPGPCGRQLRLQPIHLPATVESRQSTTL